MLEPNYHSVYFTAGLSAGIQVVQLFFQVLSFRTCRHCSEPNQFWVSPFRALGHIRAMFLQACVQIIGIADIVRSAVHGQYIHEKFGSRVVILNLSGWYASLLNFTRLMTVVTLGEPHGLVIRAASTPVYPALPLLDKVVYAKVMSNSNCLGGTPKPTFVVVSIVRIGFPTITRPDSKALGRPRTGRLPVAGHAHVILGVLVPPA